MTKVHPAERGRWSAPGFLESLRSAPVRPADSLLALESSGALLLALPAADAARSAPAAELTDATAQGQDVLLYVIDMPEMDITFDDPPQGAVGPP